MNNMAMKWLGLVAVALLIAACAGQKGPAEKAVADMDASVAAIRDDAAKYAATELQQVDGAIASLKESLAKGDYKAVLAGAPAVTSQIASLQQTVTAKRDEAQAAMMTATDQWKTLSSQVPDMVSAIQSRIDVLSQSKKLPKNISAASFQAAKDGLDFMQTNWTQATKQFGAGDPVSAVASAQAAQTKGTEVMQLLGMG